MDKTEGFSLDEMFLLRSFLEEGISPDKAVADISFRQVETEKLEEEALAAKKKKEREKEKAKIK